MQQASTAKYMQQASTLVATSESQQSKHHQYKRGGLLPWAALGQYKRGRLLH